MSDSLDDAVWFAIMAKRKDGSRLRMETVKHDDVDAVLTFWSDVVPRDNMWTETSAAPS